LRFLFFATIIGNFEYFVGCSAAGFGYQPLVTMTGAGPVAEGSVLCFAEGWKSLSGTGYNRLHIHHSGLNDGTPSNCG